VYFRPGPNLGAVWPLTNAVSRKAVASVVSFSFIRVYPEHRLSAFGTASVYLTLGRAVKRIIFYFLFDIFDFLFVSFLLAKNK
jgi:hypothetical protein